MSALIEQSALAELSSVELVAFYRGVPTVLASSDVRPRVTAARCHPTTAAAYSRLRAQRSRVGQPLANPQRRAAFARLAAQELPPDELACLMESLVWPACAHAIERAD
jgi:hypothetical protein